MNKYKHLRGVLKPIVLQTKHTLRGNVAEVLQAREMSFVFIEHVCSAEVAAHEVPVSPLLNAELHLQT
jgi:hypothetical protein